VDIALTYLGFGLLATASPCVLPLYPGFLAYLGGQTGERHGPTRYLLGFFVLGGVLTAMVVLGAVIAALSMPIARMLAVVIPLAIVAIFALGVLLILDRNPFYRMPQIGVPLLRRPALNAYAYGLLYGPIALPCSGPLVVGMFVYSVTITDVLTQLWGFAWFGVGLGLPLLLISLLSGALQRDITRWFAQRRRILNLVAGVLMIAVALYALSDNWAYLQLYYS
jgi:cytochrome c-type biogenesis protein